MNFTKIFFVFLSCWSWNAYAEQPVLPDDQIRVSLALLEKLNIQEARFLNCQNKAALLRKGGDDLFWALLASLLTQYCIKERCSGWLILVLMYWSVTGVYKLCFDMYDIIHCDDHKNKILQYCAHHLSFEQIKFLQRSEQHLLEAKFLEEILQYKFDHDVESV
jgi:hypothetical protein